MSTALVVPTNGVPMASTGRVQLGGAAAMQQTIEDLDTIRKFVAGAMIKDVDYGVIPGTGSKATLYLPGAQKTLMYFNCYPEYTIEPRELDKGHVEYIVKTLLKSRSSQMPTGSGIGSCSTMESKYRWRKGGRVCPKCGSDAIINGKAEYGGGFICFAKKGGCGAKFAESDTAITSQATGRTENPDIYDQRNTVLKMSKKRSLVDSALGLGCMSELFTQDLEDNAPDHHDDRPARVEPSRDREPARDPQAPRRPQGQNSNRAPEPAAASAESATKVMGRFSECLSQYCQKMNAAWIDRHTSEDGVIAAWVRELVNSFQLVNHMLKEAGITFPNGGQFNERMRAASELWLADENATLTKWNAYVKGLAEEAKRKQAAAEPEDENQELAAALPREPGCDDDRED